MAKEKAYRLLYKVSYRHNPMGKYERYDVKASSLAGAKRIVKKRHPKATMLKYKYQYKVK